MASKAVTKTSSTPSTGTEPRGSAPTSMVSASKKAGVGKRVITPNSKDSMTSLDRRMTVEKGIVDELLLVCGVIGTSSNEGDELVPVTDCLNWLQDLQRALRRDEDLYRPISLLIGKWKVVEQKLLPLVVTCRYDTPIVLTVVKILVILTKPLSENTKRAGKMIIDTSSKSNRDVVQQQIKLRENALEQAELLMEYKRVVAHHVSHHSQQKGGTGLLSIFVSLLAEPLSKTGASRTDADHLTIELVLHLFRNLLSAHPLLNSTCILISTSFCFMIFETLSHSKALLFFILFYRQPHPKLLARQTNSIRN
jgi:timeless